MGKNEIYFYINSRSLWVCIDERSYVDYCHGDPCYIGRGETPEKAHLDRIEREATNDWTDLLGEDPRYREENRKKREKAELEKTIKKLAEDYPDAEEWLKERYSQIFSTEDS